MSNEPADASPRALLERGRESYRVRAWADACGLLLRADRATSVDLDDLELLAWSAGLCGRDDLMLTTLERLYHQHFECSNAIRAARMAFWIAFRLLSLGEGARANAWLVRADRLVERENVDCVERGYLLLPVARRYMAAGELDRAHVVAKEAAAIGERFGESDLLAFARSLQGRVLVQQARTTEGLALLDEALLSATSGELSPVMTGLIYCAAIDCCCSVYALGRAREWTVSLASWCDAQPQLVPFAAPCLVHRAEILEVGGAWTESIAEARRAQDLAPKKIERASLADSFYQQAEIHRLRGEHAQAEFAYRNASEHGREPQPGLALLRAAEGQHDAAAGAIRRVLDSVSAPLQRAKYLPAFVEIMLEVDALDAARDARNELEAVAAQFESEVLGALAARARGEVCLAEGDARAAVAPLRHAFDVWQRVDAPYIAARIRVGLARAFHSLGDDDGANLELDAARSTFERLGAQRDIGLVDSLRIGDAPAQKHGLSTRELEVLRLVATGMTNKIVARELFLSERTVDRHVSNIFDKLNVETRAAATAYAYEHGLVLPPHRRIG